MIITCPTCGQGYDTTGYPDNYRFVCSCGTPIDAAALAQQQASETASPAVSPDATMRTQPPAPSSPPSSSQWNAHGSHASSPSHTASYGSPSADMGLGYGSPSADVGLGAVEDLYPVEADDAEPTAVTRSPYHNMPSSHDTPAESGPSDHVASHYEPPAPPSSASQAGLSQALPPSYAPESEAGYGEATPGAPSWENLPDESVHTGEGFQPALDESPPERTEPRAIWAMVLAFAVVLGPIVWLLGWRSRRSIRLAPSIFRGKRLATFTMFLGMLETFGLAGLLFLVFSEPKIHPLVTRTARWMGVLQPLESKDTLAGQPTDPSRLHQSQARKLLLQAWKTRPNAKPLALASLYVYQEADASYAHAYWYNPRLQRTQRALFFRSNRGHWHLVQTEIAYKEEARVAATGNRQLTVPLARRLIQQFWKLRGRFIDVHIHRLYVVQGAKARTASAYWVLRKKRAGLPVKTWNIRSRFRLSSSQRWHLVQYAMRVPSDELHAHAVTATQTLRPENTKELLESYFREQKKTFAGRQLRVYQEPGAREAWLYWLNRRRQPQRSLFRYATNQQWHLARLNVPPTATLSIREKGAPRLSQTIAERMLRSYLRPTRRARLLQHVCVVQAPGAKKAMVRWQLNAPPPKRGSRRAPAPTKPRQSLFTYTQSGAWVLTLPSLPPAPEVLYHQKGGLRLTPALARALLRRYWKEESWKSSMRRFSGAQIQDLYVFQEPKQTTAAAHWVIQNNDQVTALRSSFYRSSQGVWYLGDYDTGRGYAMKPSASGPPLLTAPAALKLLTRATQTAASHPPVAIRDLYVYQPSHSHRAYIRSVWYQGRQARVVFSLLHRSNQNRWYVSVLELPHPPTQ